MTTPWQHQREATDYILSHDRWYLDDDMGCGKTRCVVDAVCDAKYATTLIVAPKSVVPVWAAQFELHRPGEVTVVTLEGSGAAKMKAFSTARRNTEGPLVVVVNYESTWRAPLAGAITSEPWSLVVTDEAHKAKAPGSKQSLFLASLKHAKRRGALSGTPFHHSPMDIYAQMRFVDPDVFGWSYVKFRARYAQMGGHKVNGRPVQVVGYQHLDELHDKFRSRCVRPAQLRKRDVLDLPPVSHVATSVALEPKTRRIYESLAANYEAEVAAGRITASNGLVKLIRLRQCTSGFGGTDDKIDAVFGHEKREALTELLDGIGSDEPVAVFCNFDHEIESVHHAAKTCERPSCELSGKRKDFADVWNAQPGEVAAINTRSGGVGVNMTSACYAVYYGQVVSLGDYDQSLARLDRPGQTRPVTYYHLLATDTVDETMRAALVARADLIGMIMTGGLKRGTSNRSPVA